MTEAERLDVRSEIAAAAGVSPGQVDKVKHLIANAIPELLQALRNGEVSIHRAWKWSKKPSEEQREALWRYQSERGIRKTIRNLVSPYRSKRGGDGPGSRHSPTEPEVGDLIKLLSAVQSGKLGPVRVVSLDVHGKAVFVTKGLFRTLEAQEELALTCATNNQ